MAGVSLQRLIGLCLTLVILLLLLSHQGIVLPWPRTTALQCLRPANVLDARDQVVLRIETASARRHADLVRLAVRQCLDIWDSSPTTLDVRLESRHVAVFQANLPRGASASFLVPNVQKLMEKSTSNMTAKTDVFFDKYQPLSVIEPWMRLLSSLFPTHVRLIEIGTTAQGKSIRAFRLGVHPSLDSEPVRPRKTIVVAGGVHAREWISTSTVTFVAHHFITMYGKSRSITSMLQYFDFVFIPTLNPDGYVHTWEVDRLWRKNRQPTRIDGCIGLDIDRSYDFGFDRDETNPDPCSETFASSEPFTAHEAQQVATWAEGEVESGKSKIVAFLDLHSYSQRILYPFAFSCEVKPPALENLEELGIGLAKAIFSMTDARYAVDSACQNDQAPSEIVFRQAESYNGGSALDWFFHRLQTPFAYQIKLRDTGNYGFLVPPEQIVPTGKEISNAVEYLALFLAGQRPTESERFG